MQPSTSSAAHNSNCNSSLHHRDINFAHHSEMHHNNDHLPATNKAQCDDRPITENYAQPPAIHYRGVTSIKTVEINSCGVDFPLSTTISVPSAPRCTLKEQQSNPATKQDQGLVVKTSPSDASVQHSFEVYYLNLLLLLLLFVFIRQ